MVRVRRILVVSLHLALRAVAFKQRSALLHAMLVEP